MSTQPEPAARPETPGARRADASAPLKRLLLVAFDFPPRRTSGVYRPTGLLKYLPGSGWDVTVLTPSYSTVGWWSPADKEGQFRASDESLLRRIPPQTRVVRTGFLRIAAWEDHAAQMAKDLGALRPLAEDTKASAADRAIRYGGAVLRSCLYFPDETIGWLPWAVSRAIRLHREQPFDLVLTTSPPRSTPLVGWWLKKLLGVAWVVEFRDPWILPADLARKFGREPFALRLMLERAVHSRLLRRADGVIVVTQGLAEELRRVNRVPEQKLTVISSGFDEEDFQPEGAAGGCFLEPEFLHLSHFGTVYPGFSASFFPALQGLLQESPEMRDMLRVNIFGYPDSDILHYASVPELREVVRIWSLRPHAEAIAAMQASHVLLTFYAHPELDRKCVPGKLYEYIRVGRPVIGIVYQGEAQKLIEQNNAGWILPPDDPDAIRRFLKKFVEDFCRTGTIPSRTKPPASLSSLRYDRLASEYAAVLNRFAKVPR